ncbi:MAG TPA: hypothetical protein VJ652_22785 [Noviherbaspirillum sp.]|nr:hypothetical protein [Noviherbaspirillum sp.]
MDYEPERIELYYFVRYFDPARKKHSRTNYKMTEETARKRFGTFELVLESREERRVGGDWRRDSAAHFHTGSPGKS